MKLYTIGGRIAYPRPFTGAFCWCSNCLDPEYEAHTAVSYPLIVLAVVIDTLLSNRAMHSTPPQGYILLLVLV